MVELSRYEVERKFYRILENGDEVAIARAIDHSQPYVNQLYSPDSDRASTLYRALKELRGWRKHNDERGRRALELFNEYANLGFEEVSGCSTDERRKLVKEITEWELSEMEGKPLDEQIAELKDVCFRAGEALKAKRAELYGTGNVREMGKVMVSRRGK